MILYKEDSKILRMYPDVVMSERVTFFYINLRKTLEQIERLLPEETQETEQLKKAYQLVLRLRSQLIGVIYDMEMCAPNAQTSVCDDTDKQSVTLLIEEPLSGMKELTSSVQEHWITLIHDAIARESQTGIPKFQKAMVTIEVTTPRGTNNAKVWDTSNRAINLIINNLKVSFFGTMILSIWPLVSLLLNSCRYCLCIARTKGLHHKTRTKTLFLGSDLR